MSTESNNDEDIAFWNWDDENDEPDDGDGGTSINQNKYEEAGTRTTGDSSRRVNEQWPRSILGFFVEDGK